jgi:hypothetical protein
MSEMWLRRSPRTQRDSRFALRIEQEHGTVSRPGSIDMIFPGSKVGALR